MGTTTVTTLLSPHIAPPPERHAHWDATAALVDAVRSGHLHGAGLDTFAIEPLPVESPLMAETRIVLSPHSAALTEQALIAMGITTVRNALAGLDGTIDPTLVVNPSVLPDHRHQSGLS